MNSTIRIDLKSARADVERALRALEKFDIGVNSGMSHPDRRELLETCQQRTDNAINALWGAAKELEKVIPTI